MDRQLQDKTKTETWTHGVAPSPQWRCSQRFEPEAQGVVAFIHLIGLLPFEGGFEVGLPGVAAFLPERVEGAVVGGFAGIVRGTVDGAEGGNTVSGGTGLSLTLVEKRMTDPLAAEFREQHRLSQIENRLDGIRLVDEGFLEIGVRLPHGCGGGCGDDLPVLDGENDDALWAAGVVFQVIAFIVHISLVEVGPFPEDLDTELGDFVEMMEDLATFDGLDLGGGIIWIF